MRRHVGHEYILNAVMEDRTTTGNLVALDVREPIWSHFYTIAPLVVVGTKEGERYNLAPKHMAMQVGWDNYFAFACTRRHATYRNIREAGYFTVSFPTPMQIRDVGMTAHPRVGDDREKPVLDDLSTFPATKIDGIFLEDSYLFLECKMERMIDGFGKHSLIVGFIEAALVDEKYRRHPNGDEDLSVEEEAHLVYFSPGRFASVRDTAPFPFPTGFEY